MYKSNIYCPFSWNRSKVKLIFKSFIISCGQMFSSPYMEFSVWGSKSNSRLCLLCLPQVGHQLTNILKSLVFANAMTN